MSSPKYTFETLKVSFPAEYVAHVELNRPKKMNAINDNMWNDFRSCFDTLAQDSNVRSVILSGSGRCFTAGLDLFNMNLANHNVEGDPSRTAFSLRPMIMRLQASLTAIEKCDKPVIAAVHGACIGGGIDITTACDIRYASSDAYFSVKEVDIGLAADVGTLQRLPRVVGNHSWVKELALTGRNFDAKEALQQGFLSKVIDAKGPEQVIKAALETAVLIAAKSPVAAQGTKHVLTYSRDHTVEEGLAYTATWNSVMLTTPDLPVAAAAQMQKIPATFAKL